MRVLLTADTVGGVWTYAVELAGELCRRGASVALAAMGGEPSSAQRAGLAALPRLRLFGSKFKLEWMDQPWEDVARAGEWLLEIARDFKPDVVHVNGYAHAALP